MSKPATGTKGCEMGKKYRNLIERIVSDENMRSAYYKTAKGRRYSAGALEFKEFVEPNQRLLADDLRAGKYQPGVPNHFYV